MSELPESPSADFVGDGFVPSHADNINEATSRIAIISAPNEAPACPLRIPPNGACCSPAERPDARRLEPSFLGADEAPPAAPPSTVGLSAMLGLDGLRPNRSRRDSHDMLTGLQLKSLLHCLRGTFRRVVSRPVLGFSPGQPQHWCIEVGPGWGALVGASNIREGICPYVPSPPLLLRDEYRSLSAGASIAAVGYAADEKRIPQRASCAVPTPVLSPTTGPPTLPLTDDSAVSTVVSGWSAA